MKVRVAVKRLTVWATASMVAVAVGIAPSGAQAREQGVAGFSFPGRDLLDGHVPLWGQTDFPWNPLKVGPDPQVYLDKTGHEQARTFGKCGCLVTALANILRFEFGDSGLPGPRWVDGVSGKWWSPIFVNQLLRDGPRRMAAGTYAYKDAGPVCGTQVLPYGLSEAAAPTVLGSDSLTFAMPEGINVRFHDTDSLAADPALMALVRREIDSGRLVVLGFPRGTGGHINLVTGYEPNGHFLLADPATGGYGKAMSDSIYDAFLTSVNGVFTYELNTHPERTWFGVWDDPGTVDVTGWGPDGARTGVDPLTHSTYEEDPSGYYWSTDPETDLTDTPPAELRSGRGVLYNTTTPGRYRFVVTNGADTEAKLVAGRKAPGQSMEVLPGGSITVPAHASRKFVETLDGSGKVTVDAVTDFDPQAVFTVSGGTTDRAATRFDGHASFDADGAVGSLDWDFGDGATTTGPVVSHQFAAPGSYRVTLRATSADGSVATTQHEVTIRPFEGDPPQTVAGTQPALTPGGWAAGAVTVHLTAHDPPGADGASGASSVTWWSDGAQDSARTRVGGPNATVTIATEGRTHLHYFATDAEGNREDEQSLDVGVDRTAPTALVTSPVEGETLSALPFVAGTATDAGSGAASAQLTLRRAADHAYWDGSSWSASGPVWLDASGSAEWWRGHDLPTGAQLPAGDYSVTARAVDRVGATGDPSTPVTATIRPRASTNGRPIRQLTPVDDPIVDSEVATAALDADHVVGRDFSAASGDTEAFQKAVSWSMPGVAVLGPAPPLRGARARALAADGSVAGVSTQNAVPRATVWRHGVPALLPPLPGSFGRSDSEARAFNGPDEVLGAATSGFADVRAVVWRHDGVPVRIPDLGGHFSTVAAVNGGGTMVGSSWLPDGRSHAFTTSPSGPATDLGTLGGDASGGYDVNDDGVVVGYSRTAASVMHAVRWDAGRISDLGPGVATSVNAAGVVGGYRNTGSAFVPAIWVDGRETDVADLVAPTSGWTFAVAPSVLFPASGGSVLDSLDGPVIVLDDGTIVGTGTLGGHTHAFEVSPGSGGGGPGGADTQPPSTTARPSPGPNGDGWNRTPVEVSLHATDGDAGSGVRGIRTTDPAHAWTPSADTTVTLTGAGRHELGFSAEDEAGNVEPVSTTTVRIDDVEPDAAATGAPRGWSRSAVTLHLTGSDEGGSGVASLTVSQSISGHTQTSTQPVTSRDVTVTGPGEVEVGFSATDRAGNEGPVHHAVVRVDPDAPVITGPPEHVGLAGAVTFSAHDAVSGVEHLSAVDTAPSGTTRVLVPGQRLLEKGTHHVRVTAVDAAGNDRAETYEVEATGPASEVAQPVAGNHAPDADAGGPYSGGIGAGIAFDGTGSRDADGDPLTYRWSFGDGSTGVGPSPRHTYAAPGSYAVWLVVNDGKEDSSSTSGFHHSFASVQVLPNRPPDCSAAAASPEVLWPPNHALRPVRVSRVTDPDGDPVTVQVIAVTQDEPVEGFGDGDTAPDAVLSPTDGLSLRAERSGTGDGRVYRVEVSGADDKGAACTARVTVAVPHHSGGSATDSGARFPTTRSGAASRN